MSGTVLSGSYSIELRSVSADRGNGSAFRYATVGHYSSFRDLLPLVTKNFKIRV